MAYEHGRQCDRCDRPAIFHVTELIGDQAKEVHLCQEHAKEYLTPHAPVVEAAKSLVQKLVHNLSAAQAAEELAEVDRLECPVCGISFREFRANGRFGCPQDYDSFHEQLEPLLVNVHGETEHKGKRPKHSAELSARRAQLIRLRREMKEAIASENYERAGEIRDEIRRIESET